MSSASRTKAVTASRGAGNPASPRATKTLIQTLRHRFNAVDMNCVTSHVKLSINLYLLAHIRLCLGDVIDLVAGLGHGVFHNDLAIFFRDPTTERLGVLRLGVGPGSRHLGLILL